MSDMTPHQDPDLNLNQDDTDQVRRDFLKRFGKYAVSTPAVFALMSTASSKAIASGQGSQGAGNGFGLDGANSGTYGQKNGKSF